MSNPALSLEDIDRLGELLARIPEPFLPMEADVLDGYLTAISLLRFPPELNEWLPFVFDQEGRDRARLEEPEQSELKKLILRRGAQLENCILNEKAIDPIVYDTDEDGLSLEGKEGLSALSSFSDGFALACSLWPELLKNDNKAVQAGLVGILRYESTAEDEQDEQADSVLEDIDNEVPFLDLDEAIADLEACVQEIAEVTRGREVSQTQKAKKVHATRRR